MSGIRERRLGKTGLMVTELGLGAMDTPQAPDGAKTIGTAMELGINFIDSGREYEGSEYLLGQVLRDKGETCVHVSTKSMSRGINAVQYDVDRSLSVLGTDHIAVYHLHDVSTTEAWDAVMAEDGALNGLKVAQYRGLIGHIAVSSHSLEIVERAIRCGEFGAVMLEYSGVLHRVGGAAIAGRERGRGRHCDEAARRFGEDERDPEPDEQRRRQHVPDSVHAAALCAI